VLPWILPVAGALALSIPLSVLSSRVDLGRALRRLGLFVTPEELAPPVEILRTLALARSAVEGPGLAQAVMDPRLNALACASATARPHGVNAASAERTALAQRALEHGLDGLDRAERGRLLNDPVALSMLHLDAWTSPRAHASWVSLRG
jgi:membrane glycosyltransferase